MGLGADQGLHQGTYTGNCATSLPRRKMLRLLLPGVLLEFAMLGRLQACCIRPSGAGALSGTDLSCIHASGPGQVLAAHGTASWR